MLEGKRIQKSRIPTVYSYTDNPYILPSIPLKPTPLQLLSPMTVCLSVCFLSVDILCHFWCLKQKKEVPRRPYPSSSPSPFLSPTFCYLSLFLPFVPPSCPFFMLEVGLFKYTGGLQKRCKLLQRGNGNQIWCIFSFKMWHLVGRTLLIFLISAWPRVGELITYRLKVELGKRIALAVRSHLLQPVPTAPPRKF